MLLFILFILLGNIFKIIEEYIKPSLLLQGGTAVSGVPGFGRL